LASLLNFLGKAADAVIPGNQSYLHNGTPVKKQLQQAAQQVGQVARQAPPGQALNQAGRGLNYAAQQIHNVSQHIDTNPLGHKLNEFVVDPVVNTDQHVAQFLQGHNPYHGNVKQQLGQAGQDALNIASVVPIGKGAEIAVKGTPLVTRAIQGAKLGAKAGGGFGVAQGVSSGMQNNLDLPGIIKSGAISGVAGAGLGAGLGVAAPVAVDSGKLAVKGARKYVEAIKAPVPKTAAESHAQAGFLAGDGTEHTDVNMKIKNGGAKAINQGRNVPLTDLIHHPVLQAKHPELFDKNAGLKVAYNPDPQALQSMIDHDTGQVLISRIQAPEIKSAAGRKQLVHEIQHAIDDSAGKPSGTTPLFERYRNASLEARDAQGRVFNSRNQVQELKSLRNKGNLTDAEYNAHPVVRQHNSDLQTIKNTPLISKDKALEAYVNDPGELQARESADRDAMTQPELDASPRQANNGRATTPQARQAFSEEAKPIGELLGRTRATIKNEADPNVKEELLKQEKALGKEYSAKKGAKPLGLPTKDASKTPGLPIYKTHKVGNVAKIARSTRSIIERQGEYGKKLAGMLQGSRDTEELFQAKLIKQLPTVLKLKGKNFENFVEATQGKEEARSPKVAQAVQEWQSTHPQIRDRAIAAGLDVGDLGHTYYPHFIDYDRIFKDTNTYNKAINHLVETGQATSQEDAIKLLGYARDVSRNRSFGNLEASRLVDLPFYDKTTNSLKQYLQSSSRRIAQTETFGAKDEEALKLIAKAGGQGYDTEAMKNAYDVAVGAKKYGEGAEQASRAIRRYVTTTKLGLGALTNLSQSANTGIVTGSLRTMGAIIKQLDPKTRQFVADTGTISDAVLNDLRAQSGFESMGKSVAGKAIDKITAPGFAKVESFNRSVASTAGRDYALRLAQKGDEKTLRNLGVTGEIKDGTLTHDQQVQAARKVVEKTQFKVDPQDLPGWTDSPGGKLVSQFRTFSYQQGKFFSNEILKPAAKGNLAPLARLMALMPIGYGLYEARRAIDGRPEEDNKARRGVESFSKLGGAGLVVDMFRGVMPLNGKYVPTDRRVSMAVGTFGGPAVGIATQGVGALSEAIQRKNIPKNNPDLTGKLAIKSGDKYTDLTSAGRFGLSQVPVIGSPIKNRLLPYKKEALANGNDQVKASNQAGADTKTDKKVRSAYGDINETDAIKKSASRLASTQEKLSPKVSRETQDTLTNYARLSDVGRKKYDSDPKNKYKLAVANYENDSLNGKYNDVQKQTKEKSLAKLKVTSDYSKEVVDFYNLSNAGKSDFFKRDSAKAKSLYGQAKELEAKLSGAGITTKKVSTATGRKTTGRKSGGRKVAGLGLPNQTNSNKLNSMAKSLRGRTTVATKGLSLPNYHPKKSSPPKIAKIKVRKGSSKLT
jgi:hypothetical protein